MSQIAFPEIDQTIVARRDAIHAGLAALLPPECLITDEVGRRAYETDALTAYRRSPLAVRKRNSYWCGMSSPRSRRT